MDDEGYVPAYLTQDRIEGRFQQHYELMLQRREMAGIYHTSHGHCNNRNTDLNLQAKGVKCNHLKCYIEAPTPPLHARTSSGAFNGAGDGFSTADIPPMDMWSLRGGTCSQRIGSLQQQ